MKRAVISAVCSAIAVLGVLHLGLFNSWQEKLFDRLHVSTPPADSIVIIAIDDVSLNEIGRWPWDRDVFAKTVSLLEGTRGVGIDINFSEASADDALLAQSLEQASTPIVLPIEQTSSGRVLVEPLPIFKQHTTLGSVSVQVDHDGIVRRSLGGGTFSHALTGASAVGDGAFRISYSGRAGTFPALSFVDVYSGNVPSRIFDDAYVLIGATATDLHDVVQTPLGQMSGVEYHANVTQALLTGSVFKVVSGYVIALLILLVSLIAAFCVFYIRRVVVLLSALVLGGVALLMLGAWAFGAHVEIPLLYILIAWIVAAGVSLTAEYVFESKQKRFIRSTFSQYLNKEVVQELIDNPGALALGGQEKRLSILFSDIRGFTSLAESMSPGEITELLNEYLDAMTDVVMDQKGVLDKYIGDAVMAFWGAPVSDSKHAAHACQAAVGMIGALKVFNKQSAHTLAIGIGINTGEVIVGNMGSKKRFDYTVLGDEVNLASRLEGLTKYYGVECIVSEATYKQAQNEEGLFFRKLDCVRVKGKKDPIALYQLSTEVFENDELFQQARGLFVAGKWGEAKVVFEKVNDGSSKFFITRCVEMENMQPADWDGVYSFDSK